MVKVAVISDNPFLVEKFKQIVGTIADASVDYYYSKQNNKPEALQALNCKPIDLKVEYQVICDRYDVAFSLHCKQVFPQKLVHALRCYNLHPGLNPYNRGWFPQVFSIINKLPAGATLHEIDEQIDHGSIIDQEPVEVEINDTSLTAYNKVLDAELRILKRSLSSVLLGKYERKNFGEGNYNSIKDYNKLLELDLNKKMTLGEAIDLLRALTHPPYRNAYFIDPETKEKYFVSISIDKASDL